MDGLSLVLSSLFCPLIGRKICSCLAVVTVLWFYPILSLSISTSLWISCIVFPVISVLLEVQLSLSSISPPQSCVKDRWFCAWCWSPDTIMGSSFATAELGEEQKLHVLKPLCQAGCRCGNCALQCRQGSLYCHRGWEWWKWLNTGKWGWWHKPHVFTAILLKLGVKWTQILMNAQNQLK